MNAKTPLESLRDYFMLHRTDSDAPAYPNELNYVLVYDEPAGVGAYGLRISGAFQPGKKFWSEAIDVTIYVDGVELGEANLRMLQISAWVHKTCCDWAATYQRLWTIYPENQPLLTITPAETGAQYVVTFKAWTPRIHNVRA